MDTSPNKSRCAWPGQDPVYLAYHDEEWGVPERDSRALFEKLSLDGFQAGLSWITILRKRDAFREAFHGFDPERVAAMGPDDVERLLSNPGIVRSRSKIRGTIANARAYLSMQEAGEEFSHFIWDAVGGAPLQGRGETPAPAQTQQSQALSAALRRRGFSFCGPVIVYAFMQAVGMVNDHSAHCFRFAELGGIRTG